MKEAIRIAKSDISDEELARILEMVDYDENGKIEYTEFLAATVDINKHLTKEKIALLFLQFDVDNTGRINSENLKRAFTKLGQTLTDD